MRRYQNAEIKGAEIMVMIELERNCVAHPVLWEMEDRIENCCVVGFLRVFEIVSSICYLYTYRDIMRYHKISGSS